MMYLQCGRNMKTILYKSCFVLLPFLILGGCLSRTRPHVRLSPTLDKRIYQTTPLPLTMGIYIDPALRNHIQEEWLRHYNVGIHRLVFPIGEQLSSKLEEMSRIIFNKVTPIDSLENVAHLNKEAFDGILAFTLKKSEIKLYIEESVWWAVGKHTLSVTATFFDPKLNKIWETEVTVEGKGLDVVTSNVEYEWWITSEPNFAPAVDEAIQKVTYELSQRLVTFAKGLNKTPAEK